MIALVGHVTESYGPMQALPLYLKKNFDEFMVVSHPFPYCSILQSKCVYIKNQKEIREFSGPKYKFKKFFVVHYVGDFILTLYFFFRLGKKWDFFIGCDCLNAFTGLTLKKLGIAKKVIFYENEYTVKRFRKEILNKIFQFLNEFTARNVDIVWDGPPNLYEVRKNQGVNLEKVILVPHGVDLEKVRILKKNNQKTLVYIGHVTESKGLQLVVNALKRVSKKVQGIKVVIIGSGPYEDELKKLIKKSRLEKLFTFWGFTDHSWTLSYLPSCGIGLAPYTPLDRQALMYAEPLKVKDYLSCGLPVIITNFGSCAKEIEKKRFGLSVAYSSRELAKAIIKLCTDKGFYKKCRLNILSFFKRITWEETYNSAFEKTFSL